MTVQSLWQWLAAAAVYQSHFLCTVEHKMHRTKQTVQVTSGSTSNSHRILAGQQLSATRITYWQRTGHLASSMLCVHESQTNEP